MAAARSVGAFLAQAAAVLSAAGFAEPRRRARRLICGVLDCPAATLLAHPERELEPREAEGLQQALRRMIEGEPFSRILGRREFWGLSFALSEDTLDPRPESETLIEAVLARLDDRGAAYRFLDLGTGTGSLLLALLSEYRAAYGFGVDIAFGAVATARRNAVALGLADRARFLVGNWGAAISGQFAAIVANPPYIASGALAGLPVEVARYDPRRALDGGEDGLAAYRIITRQAPALLMPGGMLAVETGSAPAATAAIIAAQGLVIDAIERDLAGVERCVLAYRGQPAGSRRARRVKKILECAAGASRLAGWRV
ncbi:MAG: peptide chain release factor N(5)-glutamine methyltransferase [Stellaceae bacterium]